MSGGRIPSLYVKSLGTNCNHKDICDIFEKTQGTSPCLLVFEDLDSLVCDNVRRFFLDEVDEPIENNGILMVGSTNYRRFFNYSHWFCRLYMPQDLYLDTYYKYSVSPEG